MAEEKHTSKVKIEMQKKCRDNDWTTYEGSQCKDNKKSLASGHLSGFGDLTSVFLSL